MQAIISRFALAAALTLPVLTSACSGENPAGATVAPSAPRLDGGATFGSGGRTFSEPTDNTTTAADSVSTASRGGVTLGSGSRLDGGATLGSGSRTFSEPTDNTTTAADSGSTAARGGLTLGSGS